MQQKARILCAIQDGAATSQDLVDETGLPRNHVAAVLRKLYLTGAIRRKLLPRDRPGRMEYFYEVPR